jgi:hypothetical protein
MVGSSSTPPPTGPASPQGTPQPHEKSEGKGYKAKPMHFLGMNFDSKEAGQLWKVICQQVSAAIQKENDRAMKALKKLGKSSDPDQADSDD